MNQELEKSQDYKELYQEIKDTIERAKKHAATQVNQALVLTYWGIGRLIKQNIVEDTRANYGQETIKKLSAELSREYGSGFSKSSLTRMIKLYGLIPEQEIVATLSQQLSWSHLIELIKIEDDTKRKFYVSMACNESWTVRVLRERINSMLYERTAISKKPEITIENDLEKLTEEKKMSTDLFLRDPYLLDFLELKDNFSEQDLENAILQELEKFILEFGSDFAFLSRQKRIQVGGDDYYIDLLFYHRKLQRLVLIELKIGSFKPEHKGQVEFYLKWLSKYEKAKDEKEPIAIILCSDKDEEVVELLDLEKDHIHISEYWLELPPKNILQEKLHKAVERAREKVVQKQIEG